MTELTPPSARPTLVKPTLKARSHCNYLITNARLPGCVGLQQIWIKPQGIIQAMQPMDRAFKYLPPEDLKVLDVAGDWVSLGGIDLQINGALGLAFPDLTPDNANQLLEICQFLWSQGVDGFLPTLVTTSIEKVHQALAVLADFMTQAATESTPMARILGVHLEGPFLNPEKRGAHPAEYLLPLTIENVKRLWGDYAELVKILTVAPELDPTGEVISFVRSLKTSSKPLPQKSPGASRIIVSLAHSQATAAEAQKAFDLGATMVTHAFNAMPPLHHREPGLLGAAITHPKVQCGLIADGQHVSPIMIDLLLRACQSKSSSEPKLFLVSDALAPLGLPDGTYPWDSRKIEVKEGTARLLDGTLAGTTLPLLTGVQNLVKWNICDVETAIALATSAPRKAIGLPALAAGQPAHLLRWRLDKSTGDLTWQRLMP